MAGPASAACPHLTLRPRDPPVAPRPSFRAPPRHRRLGARSGRAHPRRHATPPGASDRSGPGPHARPRFTAPRPHGLSLAIGVEVTGGGSGSERASKSSRRRTSSPSPRIGRHGRRPRRQRGATRWPAEPAMAPPDLQSSVRFASCQARHHEGIVLALTLTPRASSGAAEGRRDPARRVQGGRGLMRSNPSGISGVAAHSHGEPGSALITHSGARRVVQPANAWSRTSIWPPRRHSPAGPPKWLPPPGLQSTSSSMLETSPIAGTSGSTATELAGMVKVALS